MPDVLEGKCLCGAVTWRFEGEPGKATACNCTACHRYAALWIYDYENERITVSGPTTAFTRADLGESPYLANHFCPTCGNIVYWRGLEIIDGRRRMAVNIRLADPAAVAHLEIRSFDGLDTFTERELHGRFVRDLWS